MNRSLVPFLLGACALSTAYAACRLIAPFYGFGPLLVSGALAISFFALGAGFLLASMRGSTRAGSGATALLVAAVWTILIPWLGAATLARLEHFGLRIATIVGIKLFAGVPLVALGFAVGRCLRTPVGETPRASDALPVAATMFGAAIATPLVVWILVPLFGVSRTLLATGAVEAIAALLVYGGARERVRAGAAAAILVLAVVCVARMPAVARTQGLVDAREGPAFQYRVVDRADGRFLLADGGIQALVSPETGDGLLRPVAALQVLDFMFTRPESALVLGLRGGVVAKRFARAGWSVRAVEPDPVAVRVASRFLSFNTGEIPVDAEDVRAFCRHTRTRYPLVILDAFDQSAVPFHLITRESFATISDRVGEGGILALVIATPGWDDPAVHSVAAMLQSRFRTVLALPTSEPPNTLGSIVLLASNRALEIPEQLLPQPTDYLLNPEEHWAVVQMNHAWFNRFAPTTEGAVILTDDKNPIDLWNDPVQYAARTELHKSFGTGPRSW